ncbi:hypothetical protein Sjap_004720 [Stephania japonica]|uniref:rRNA N-glycosylase n=1 Tax=Stephania japonica TaxID=461633 RepID=A0AAP0PI24_9MAGN
MVSLSPSPSMSPMFMSSVIVSMTVDTSLTSLDLCRTHRTFYSRDATWTSPEPLRSANYNALESRAGAKRTNIPLGLQALLGAISALISRPEDAHSLLIVIQMISEAVRYWEIESRVRNNAQFTPNGYMTDLETNWGRLSEQIQTSDFLAFETEITIGDRVADNVNSFVIAGLYLMLFVCNPPAQTSTTTLSVSHLQLIKHCGEKKQT